MKVIGKHSFANAMHFFPQIIHRIYATRTLIQCTSLYFLYVCAFSLLFSLNVVWPSPPVLPCWDDGLLFGLVIALKMETFSLYEMRLFGCCLRSFFCKLARLFIVGNPTVGWYPLEGNIMCGSEFVQCWAISGALLFVRAPRQAVHRWGSLLQLYY